MSQVLKFFDDWWSLHPHLVEILLFCAAVAASLFPGFFRWSLISPLRHAGRGTLRLAENTARDYLDIVHRLNGDPFKLVAYIVRYSINALFMSLGYSGAFGIVYSLYSRWRGGNPSFIWFFVVLGGILLGRLNRLYVFVGVLLIPNNGYIKFLEGLIREGEIGKAE
jgi:hypothetical protein